MHALVRRGLLHLGTYSPTSQVFFWVPEWPGGGGGGRAVFGVGRTVGLVFCFVFVLDFCFEFFSSIQTLRKKKKTKTIPDSFIVCFLCPNSFIAYVLHCPPIDI